jgi:predicted DNA-binding protein
MTTLQSFAEFTAALDDVAIAFKMTLGIRHPNPVTERLVELSKKTPFPLLSLKAVKMTYRLTDYGVEEVIDFAGKNACDLFIAADVLIPLAE